MEFPHCTVHIDLRMRIDPLRGNGEKVSRWPGPCMHSQNLTDHFKLWPQNFTDDIFPIAQVSPEAIDLKAYMSLNDVCHDVHLTSKQYMGRKELYPPTCYYYMLQQVYDINVRQKCTLWQCDCHRVQGVTRWRISIISLSVWAWSHLLPSGASLWECRFSGIGCWKWNKTHPIYFSSKIVCTVISKEWYW